MEVTTNFLWFSAATEGRTDVSDTAQLPAFVRGIDIVSNILAESTV
jgi:hypothetical protein